MKNTYDEEYYSMDRLCENCWKIFWVKIPVGMKSKDYFRENTKCPICKCDFRK